MRKYTEKDYKGGSDDKGPLNLKVAEKGLIIKVFFQFRGDKKLMAKALQITERGLYNRLEQHDLLETFSQEEEKWKKEQIDNIEPVFQSLQS